jgi:hypothetical protein
VCGLDQEKEENSANLAKGLRGGSGGGQDATAGGAGGARPMSGGEVLRLENKGKGAGKDCSPHGKTLAKGRAAEV